MSLSDKVIKGSFTLLLMRLFLRGSGIVSMLLLARLLSAEDFGLVAIASSAVFLFDILSQTGAGQYIIQKDEVSDDDLNTVWTLNLLLKMMVWLLFIISIPYISIYFSEPRLSPALYTISIILLFSGLDNPGMALYHKELNYKPIFQLAVIDKIVSFTVVIFLAFYLRNYWAMIIGVVVSYATKLLATYYLHSFRPSWSLKKISEQWTFSKWMLLKGVLGYVRAQFDILMVSKFFGVSALGGYNMMKNLSFIPAQDIVIPATEPLLSSFSKVKTDQKRLSYQITCSILVISMAIFPIVVFFAQFHHLIIVTLLGKQWGEYSILLGIMSVLIFTFSFVAIFQHALTAVGKVKIIFFYDLISVALIVSVLLIVNLSSLVEFTILRSLLALIVLLPYSYLVFRIFSINIWYLLKVLLPVFFACLSASYISLLVNSFLSIPLLAVFFIIPVVFFSVYVANIFLLYRFYKEYEEIRYLHLLISNTYKALVQKIKKRIA